MNADSVVTNPFPFEAAVNLESISFTSTEIDRVVLPPTAPLPHLIELRDVCRNYLGRIPTREKSQGRCFFLVGENGTGKTHALGDALVRVACGRLTKAADVNAPSVAPRSPLVLYAKMREESSTFVTLHRELLGKVTLDDWRSLGRDAGAMLATGKQVPEGATVEELLSKLIIDRGVLWRMQAEAMRPAGKREDFTLAFSYIMAVELKRDTTLAASARDWLAGREISAEDQLKLGVQGPLATPEDAAQAIQFLSTLCGLADRPLVIAVDQLEKLVTRTDGSPDMEILGLLHSLVETAPFENTLLVFAGTSRAWDAFPPDLRRRIVNNLIPCERLSILRARNVVATYLNPSGLREHEASDEELRPFLPEAVRQMLTSGGGSIRRLLQLAAKGFEKAANGQLVDAALIESIAQKSEVYRNDRGSVRSSIELSLRRRAFAFSPAYKLPNSKADFAIFGPDGNPRVLIAVSESIYAVDEVSRASELLQMALDAGSFRVPPLLILVVAGYASAEVVRKLGEVPFQVSIYDPETFAEGFAAILDAASLAVAQPPAPASVSSPTPDTGLADRIDRIDANLRALAEQRGHVNVAIENRFEEEGRRQLAPRLSQRRQEARRGWVAERNRLEDSIVQAREKRASADLAELKRLRDKGEAARRSGSDVWSLLVVMLALVALVMSVFGFRGALAVIETRKQELNNLVVKAPKPGEKSPEVTAAEAALHDANGPKLIMELLGVYSILFLGYACARLLLVRHALVSRTQRDLSKAVETVAELDALARSYLASSRVRGDRSRPRSRPNPFLGFWPVLRSVSDLLLDPNPHFRYAGLVALTDYPELAERYLRESQLIPNIQEEQSSLLRRKRAEVIGSHGFLEQYKEFFSRWDPVTQAHCLESEIERGWSTAKETQLGRKFFSKPLTVLKDLMISERFDEREALRPMMTLLVGTDEGLNALVKGFEVGLEKSDLSFMDNLSENQLMDAAKLVSPLLPGGLGSFDHLKVIGRVDALFLFLRELLFYKDWGDLLTLSETLPETTSALPAARKGASQPLRFQP